MNKKSVIITVLLVVGLIVAVVLFASYGKANNPDSEDFDWDAAEKKAVNKMFPGIEFGEVIKKVKDPNGNTISIKKDENYGAIVDLTRFAKKASEMTKNSKHLSDEELYNLNATDDQKEAIESVINYITMGGISQGYAASELFIRDALAYKGYDSETIEFAMTHAGVDWDEQAYIQTLILAADHGISKEELFNAMVEMGLSEDAANREANREEMDYYEQAVAYACYYKFKQDISARIDNNNMKYKKEDVREMLKTLKFNNKEIKYALKVVFDEIKVK